MAGQASSIEIAKDAHRSCLAAKVGHSTQSAHHQRASDSWALSDGDGAIRSDRQLKIVRRERGWVSPISRPSSPAPSARSRHSHRDGTDRRSAALGPDRLRSDGSRGCWARAALNSRAAAANEPASKCTLYRVAQSGKTQSVRQFTNSSTHGDILPFVTTQGIPIPNGFPGRAGAFES